jgi:DNA replicative helicase MCM subunit Mcm2 (Cdc46/Mcm family)
MAGDRGLAGKFLSITGTVIRATTVKTLEYERLFSCKKCGHTWAVQVRGLCTHRGIDDSSL